MIPRVRAARSSIALRSESKKARRGLVHLLSYNNFINIYSAGTLGILAYYGYDYYCSPCCGGLFLHFRRKLVASLIRSAPPDDLVVARLGHQLYAVA
jgi:hypothetical protein